MSTSAPGTRLLPADWLLAETTRRIEEQHGEFVVDDPATLHAAAAATDSTRKIVERARRRPGGLRLQRSVERSLATMRWTVAVLALLGLLAGAAAAGGVETGHGTIALSYALLVLLALPGLMLLLWVVLSLATRGRTTSGLIGRAGWQLGLALRSRAALSPERHQLGLALAEFGRLRGGVLMALATHTFWAAFMVGAVAWLWIRFLGLRFDFSWETTLLAGHALASWITAIGAVPQLLPGVEAPSLAQAQAVLDGRSGPGERTLWAGYLLGTLVVYGLAPRLLLAGFFSWRWRRIRLALDLDRPGYLALAAALDAADGRTLGRRGTAPPEPVARRDRARASPGPGPAVALGLELETPPARQARLAPGAEWLGSASDRVGRDAVRRALEGFRPRPGELIVLCSMARTPDRGSGAWLAELDSIVPVQIRLVETDVLRSRGGDIDSRLEDWSGLAARFGLAAPEPVD